MDDLESLAPHDIQELHPFLCQYLTSSASYLTTFARDSESKLYAIDKMLRRVQTELDILTTKLDSIVISPSSNSAATNTLTSFSNLVDVDITTSSSQEIPTKNQPEPEDITIDIISPKDDQDELLVKDHPDYKRFFRLLSLGAPAAQLKLKMGMEGLRAEYLDTPHAKFQE